MNVIRKSQIKYIKLCLISPWLEQILNIIYLISLPMLIFNFIEYSGGTTQGTPVFSQYEITQEMRTFLDELSFRNITSQVQFETYFGKIMNQLYHYENSNLTNLPLFIPVGSIRLRKYSVEKSLCGGIMCTNCTPVDLYSQIKNNIQCFSTYSANVEVATPSYSTGNSNASIWDSFVRPLSGKYGTYDLISDGEYEDIKYTSYKTDQGIVKTFTNDTNIRFLVVMINFYSPYTQNYLSVYCGIEMLQYFSHTNHIFSSHIFNVVQQTDLFFLILYALLIVCFVLNILKLIYEMNLKLMIFIHFCQMIHEIINLALIVFLTIYMTASKQADIVTNAENEDIHRDFFYLVAIRSYLLIIFSFALFCYPFRLISFLSWFKKRSKYLITYLNVVFRMLPGVLIISLTVGLFLFSFASMLYSIYSESFEEYSSLFSALINLFNINFAFENLKDDSQLSYSLSISPLYLLYNAFITYSIFVIIFITIATYSYMFKKASLLEVKKEEDEVAQKLDELREKIESFSKEEEEPLSKEEIKSRRQIIWLGLTNSNELYNEKSGENYKIMLFTSSNQIISFLKYLFAIKPKMQFEDLDKKFAIIVECRSLPGCVNMLREADLDQVDILFDWLNFAGCRIPVAIHTPFNLDRNLKMSISSTYWDIKFINTKFEINDFFEMEKEKEKYQMNQINEIKLPLGGNKLQSKSNLSHIRFMQNASGPRFTIGTEGANTIGMDKKANNTGNIKNAENFLKIVENSRANPNPLSLNSITNSNSTYNREFKPSNRKNSITENRRPSIRDSSTTFGLQKRNTINNQNTVNLLMMDNTHTIAEENSLDGLHVNSGSEDD